ncbi:MAG: hypothetical protein D6E12_07830 [Desulfovibrio sp.]|nr:MAG: hypothetical protein D6E12_07830 [Desulfovibrio sp.]
MEKPLRASELLTVGLGAGLLLKDKLEESWERMRARGEQGRDEADRLRQRAEQRYEREAADWEAKIKDKVREVIKDLGLATREDVEAAVQAKD